MLLPNTALFVEFIADKNMFYILNKHHVVKLSAHLDSNSNIIELTVFDSLGNVLKHYISNNERMFFEILFISERELTLKVLNRYCKIEKVRFL